MARAEQFSKEQPLVENELPLSTFGTIPLGYQTHPRTDRAHFGNSHGCAANDRRLGHLPQCGQSSCRVHSRRQRKLADLPFNGKRVGIQVLACRFFFTGTAYNRKIVVECLPALARAHARTTVRRLKCLSPLILPHFVSVRSNARVHASR